MIKGEYQEATNVLDSFELKVKDFRDDYLKMILLQDYEEAIKVIESKTNKYMSTAVINSFWKGFCLYRIGNVEDAIKEFVYV